LKPIHLNLAARPFRDYRPVYAVVVIASLLVAFLMLNNVDTYYRYVRETRTTRDDIARIDAAIQQEHDRAEAARRDITRIDLVALSKESKFVNSQIAQRAFSWSELLDRLERVLPNNVRVISISPSFADNGLVHLSLVLEGKASDSLLTTLTRLQRDAHFASPFPSALDTGNGYHFSITVDYKPGVARVVSR
jgi:hypothetical protein